MLLSYIHFSVHFWSIITTLYCLRIAKCLYVLCEEKDRHNSPQYSPISHMNWLFFFFLLTLSTHSVSLSVVDQKLIRTREDTLTCQKSIESEVNMESRQQKFHREHQSEHRFDRLKVHLNVSRSVRPSVLCPSESYWPLDNCSGQ